MNNPFRKLALTLTSAVLISGCWNGVPFQVDLSSKLKVDHPEGNPNRSEPASPAAPPVQGSNKPSATPAASESPPADVYKDYDIPGQVKLAIPSVLQPRGQEPQYQPMFRDDMIYPYSGGKTHIYLTVTTFQQANLVQDDPRRESAWTRFGILVDKFGVRDSFGAGGQVTVKSFDGSWLKSEDTGNVNQGIVVMTDIVMYKPLYATANVNGRLGYSKPFVMTPNEKGIRGGQVAVRLDIPVVYAY